MTTEPAPAILLRAAGVAVLLDCSGDGLPRVLHWGADVEGLDAGPALLRPGVTHSAFDTPWPFTLLPSAADGWSGRPGLSAAGGAGPVRPRWTVASTGRPRAEDDGATRLEIEAEDPDAGLGLTTEVRLEADGLLRIRHTLTNRGAETIAPRELLAVLPLPERAAEVLDLTGRWCRERTPQRSRLGLGTRARESRRGRTGHDAPLLFACGTPGFGFRTGEVWAVHVAWSGDHLHYAERLPEGAGWHAGPVLGGGELLGDGEVRLAAGESLTTPWVCFSYGRNGLDEASARFHRWLRSRPNHPDPQVRPRPLVLNTWEAVYFDHDLERLTRLAEVAASVGVERFVLDDGWFGGRRHDQAGLGDWTISPAVWPDGSLRTLAERVRGLGMEFGIWFEPEMVNLDSDLVRAHPDWLLGPDAARAGRPWRHQYLLDLANRQAYAHLLEQISAVVTELGVAYIKWDHNRDLHEMPAHAQTLAAYRLLDELRERHPGLEIESCSSGGARADLGVLEHTDRVWGSDTNDAVERQQIQRFTTFLLPPELLGSHVGPPQSHTTARVVDLPMRLVTALFAHAGFEWDITTCTDGELDALRRWTALYREVRHVLHTGDVVRADLPSSDPDEPECLLHGVVSRDRERALFAYVRLRTSAGANPGRLRLPGLDPGRRYRVAVRREVGLPHAAAISQPAWWSGAEPVEATGAYLAEVGLAAPLMHPAQATLLDLTAV